MGTAAQGNITFQAREVEIIIIISNFAYYLFKDFATRSLSDGDKNSESGFIVELKRTWEQR